MTDILKNDTTDDVGALLTSFGGTNKLGKAWSDAIRAYFTFDGETSEEDFEKWVKEHAQPILCLEKTKDDTEDDNEGDIQEPSAKRTKSADDDGPATLDREESCMTQAVSCRTTSAYIN